MFGAGVHHPSRSITRGPQRSARRTKHEALRRRTESESFRTEYLEMRTKHGEMGAERDLRARDEVLGSTRAFRNARLVVACRVEANVRTSAVDPERSHVPLKADVCA